jgi:GT2 family glycosyltransferase
MSTLDYIHGACCGITQECLEGVGLLAEEYFLYWEDVEYGLRARRAGFRCAVAQTSPLQHRNQGTDDAETTEAKTYYRVRNALHVVEAYGTPQARLWARARLPFRMLRARMTGNTTVLEALADARRKVFGPNPRTR